MNETISETGQNKKLVIISKRILRLVVQLSNSVEEHMPSMSRPWVPCQQQKKSINQLLEVESKNDYCNDYNHHWGSGVGLLPACLNWLRWCKAPPQHLGDGYKTITSLRSLLATQQVQGKPVSNEIKPSQTQTAFGINITFLHTFSLIQQLKLSENFICLLLNKIPKSSLNDQQKATNQKTKSY